MKNKFYQLNPWIPQFFEDIKKRKFWSIQFLNLLRPLQIISLILLLGYCGIIILASFLSSKDLSFSLHQQKLIVGSLETVVLIVMTIHLISTVIKATFTEGPDELIISAFKFMISKVPFYFIGISCLILTINLNFVNELFNSFPAASLFSLFVVSLITEKITRFMMTREILNDNTLDNWLVFVKDTKETTFLSSVDSLYHLPYTKHSIKVRLKYSRHCFVFSGISSGETLNNEEMSSLLNNLPQMPKIKVMAVRGVGSGSKFKKEKHKE